MISPMSINGTYYDALKSKNKKEEENWKKDVSDLKSNYWERLPNAMH